jgi:hypothetical protein
VSETVVAAYAIPGLSKPTGLAVRGNDVYVLGEDGSVVIVDAGHLATAGSLLNPASAAR